jgi:hypothetical protein
MPVHTYDRIEISEIKPDVTRVILRGGVCPYRTKTVTTDRQIPIATG